MMNKHTHGKKWSAAMALMAGATTVAIGAPAASASSSLPSPYHEWNFNSANVSGATVNDIGSAMGTAAAANGTLVGGATIGGGVLTTAGGTNQGVSLPSSIGTLPTSDTNGAFTVVDWFTFNSQSKSSNTLSFALYGSASYARELPNVFGGAQLQAGPNGSAGLQGAGLPANGALTMVAFSYNPDLTATGTGTSGGYIYYYENGSLQGSGNYAKGLSLGTMTDVVAGIGGFSNAAMGQANAAFYGTTSDFQIYASQLTPAQLAALNTAGPNTGSAAVPEPEPLALLALAAGGMLMLGRRVFGSGHRVR